MFPVPGSVAPPSSPMVWYPLFPQKNIPFACYLEHIYSIFTAIESRILPAKFLSTNYVLPACCLHIKYIHLCISFPLICDQYRIYILLICNPTLHLYITHCMPVCSLSWRTYILPYTVLPESYSYTPDKLHQPPIPPPPTPEGSGQRHTLPRDTSY